MANAIDKVKYTIKTRLNKDATEKEVTEVTVIYDDPTAERMFASRGILITAQAIFRASGEIPATYEVKVSELAKRERGGFTMKATPDNALKLLGKLNDADMTVALTQLGMSRSAIAAILANRPKPAQTPVATKTVTAVKPAVTHAATAAPRMVRTAK